MIWNICFHCDEHINGMDAYHVVSGYVSQMNHEMDSNSLYTLDGEKMIQTAGAVRTTLEIMSYNKSSPQHIIKSFHRECWLAVAGKEYL